MPSSFKFIILGIDETRANSSFALIVEVAQSPYSNRSSIQVSGGDRTRKKYRRLNFLFFDRALHPPIIVCLSHICFFGLVHTDPLHLPYTRSRCCLALLPRLWLLLFLNWTPSVFEDELLSFAPPSTPGLSGTALVEDRNSVVGAGSSKSAPLWSLCPANCNVLFSLGATTRRWAARRAVPVRDGRGWLFVLARSVLRL